MSVTLLQPLHIPPGNSAWVNEGDQMSIEVDEATAAAEREQYPAVLIVLDHTGDTRLMWDKKVKAEVKASEELFDKMKAKGYLAYTVNKDGSPGEVISEFDPKAEKIIMSPQLVGG